MICPIPFVLFVNFTLANVTGSRCQWAPKLGLSGCIYTGLGGGGSDLPPANHSPFTYFHRFASICTNSRRTEYIEEGSSPLIWVCKKTSFIVGLSVFWTEAIKKTFMNKV